MPFGVSGSPSGYSIGSYAPGGRSTVVPNGEQEKPGSNHRTTPYDQKVHGGNSGNPSSSSSSTGSNRSGSSAPTATDAVARQQLEQRTKENAQLKADLESSNKALAVCQKEAEELSREVGWLQLKNDIYRPDAEKEVERRVNERMAEITKQVEERAAQEKRVAEWNAFSPFHPPL